MPLDRSWRAVFRPWETGDEPFAALAAPAPLDPGRRFDVGTAATCAELSRLAYQPDAGVRGHALARAGMRERALIAAGPDRALVVEAPGAVVVAFRGTVEPESWRTNLDGLPRPWGDRGRVHAGFRDALEAIRPALVPHYGTDRPLVFTGHSLGGALATLATARDAAAVTYTFGAPRVGTRSFVRAVADAALHRIVHAADAVPALPPSAAGYKHAGALRYLDAAGALLDSPPRTRIYAVRLVRALDIPDLREEAPAALADHAPGAYVARLAALARRSPADGTGGT